MNLIKTISLKAQKVITFDNRVGAINTFLNPVSYVILRQNNTKIDSFDKIYVDGILLVLMLNIFQIRSVNRISFDMTSLAPKLFSYVEKNHKSIYFIGSTKDEIDNFVGLIKNKYNLNIKGYRDGYFDINKCENIISKIIESNPDYLVVGMGSPRQEEFLLRFKAKNLLNITCFTCGGFFHQTQNKINYYPQWVDNLNLRMPYRLFKEKLYSRLKFYPLFIFYFLADYIRFKTKK